jgi:cytochrome c
VTPRRKHPLAAGLAAAVLASSGPALAAGGDVAYGEYLSSTCVTCHKPGGGQEGIPSIAGLPEEVFAEALRAYQRKERPNAVMQTVAASLGPDEIAALAAYFATLKP